MSVKQLITAEELWNMPEASGKRFELVDGELVEVPGASGVHGLIALLVGSLIRAFVTEKRIGVAFGDGTAYILQSKPDLVRIPDASYVSWDRIPEGGVPDRFMPLAPDLAIEIVSPGDTAQEVYDKVHQYLDAGTLMVWVLWPRYQAVTQYRANGHVQEFSAEDVLDGGNVLPGFRVMVSDLFDVPARP